MSELPIPDPHAFDPVREGAMICICSLPREHDCHNMDLRARLDMLHDQRHAEARKADDARQEGLKMAATALDALTILRGCRDIFPAEWDAVMTGPMGPSFATVWDKLREIHKTGMRGNV